METLWIWIVAIIFFVVLLQYIGLRGVVDSYRKNPSNKIFYIIGLFSILSLAWYFWDKNYNDNRLVSLIVLFVIAMAYTFVWKKNGYQFGTERYKNTVAARVVKFFGVLFIAITSVFLILLITLWLGWIKFPNNSSQVQNQTQSTNLKTYISSDFGFQFKYPDDWVITTSSRPTSPVPLTNFSFHLNGKPVTLAIASDCCREGLIEYRRIPMQVDGKNLGLTLYGYAENLGESKIDPKNSSRLAIFAIPPSLLTPTATALKTEGVDLELLFEATDEEDVLNLFNQILTSFKFAR